jgi:hemolysin III
MWATAVVGIIQSIFWVKAPKMITAILYVAMGWFAIPYIQELKNSLGLENVILIIAGGVVYSIGAVFYAIKKPKIIPEIFGYHELFHLFTIIGAGLHFIVIYQLIS